MIMDALDTLPQLAHADQLAILEAVQNCVSNQPSADQDLLDIPDEDILNTPRVLDTPVTMSEHIGNNFLFHSDNALTSNYGCRQEKLIGKYMYVILAICLD